MWFKWWANLFIERNAIASCCFCRMQAAAAAAETQIESTFSPEIIHPPLLLFLSLSLSLFHFFFPFRRLEQDVVTLLILLSLSPQSLLSATATAAATLASIPPGSCVLNAAGEEWMAQGIWRREQDDAAADPEQESHTQHTHIRKSLCIQRLMSCSRSRSRMCGEDQKRAPDPFISLFPPSVCFLLLLLHPQPKRQANGTFSLSLVQRSRCCSRHRRRPEAGNTRVERKKAFNLFQLINCLSSCRA